MSRSRLACQPGHGVSPGPGIPARPWWEPGEQVAVVASLEGLSDWRRQVDVEIGLVSE